MADLESQEVFKHKSADSYNLFGYSQVCKNIKGIWAEHFIIHPAHVLYTMSRSTTSVFLCVLIFLKNGLNTQEMCSIKFCLVSWRVLSNTTMCYQYHQLILFQSFNLQQRSLYCFSAHIKTFHWSPYNFIIRTSSSKQPQWVSGGKSPTCYLK